MINSFFLALRPYHWIKNLFVLMPLVFAKKLGVFPETLYAIMGFLLFSALSSTGYIFNDLIDYENDKLHRVKRLRPIASGRLSKNVAAVAGVILGVVSLFFSFLLHRDFVWVITAYFVLNMMYSKFLKKVVIVDVFVIGIFFILRVFAGALIIDVELSHWMIFMVFLLALFLGYQKRRQEIRGYTEAAAKSQREVLAQYNIYFIDQMIGVLTTSLIVVYMLYTIDSRTVSVVGTDKLIYTIPFVYYGIFRYLYLVHVKVMGEDPVVAVLSDLCLRINLGLWMITCIYVIYF